MDQQEKAKLESYLLLVRKAIPELSDALATGSMSDAKSAVFALSDDLDSFAFSDAALANELRVMADAAWTEITAPRSTDERAGSAMFEVGRLEKFINGRLGANS